jgi:hypothetical protein
MTRVQARRTLQALPEHDRQVLQELWFMYELQDVTGNEGSPSRLLHRLEREFAHPVVADPAIVKAALDESRKLAASLPAGTPGSDYDNAARIAEPVLGAIVSPREALGRLLDFPEDIALAWLVDQYFSSEHYHTYNMTNRIFELVVETFGKRALPMIEDRLRKSAPVGIHQVDGVYWQDAVTAARPLLGREFTRWYYRIKGTSYEQDEAAQGR